MKKVRLVSLPNLRDAAKRNSDVRIEYKEADLKPTSFLTSWGSGKIFVIRTYGCQANVRDSEIIRGYLLSLGMKESDDFNEADFILFNTCAVRENAENHLYGELGAAKKRYEKNNGTVIAICGCVMQEEVPVKYVLEHFPFISLIFGTHNIPAFYSLLEDSIKNNVLIVDVKANSNQIVEEKKVINKSRASKITAFVNIMYGCDKFCTYCIVPYTRGKERSRKEEDIISEVKCLIDEGYKQVTLLGQNVDAYGKDFGDKYAFAGLLEKVAQTGIERVRFTTPYPSDFNPEVFKVMAKYPNIMPCIHMPLQSGSNNVLKRMNRRYTREQYLDIIKDLKNSNPDIFITTDIIVGFPGETDQDFEDTMSLVDEVKYDSAYTFIFSPRPGTPAYHMKNDLTDEVIHSRFDRLKKKVDSLTEERSKTFLGKEVKVLFESVSKKNEEMITGYEEHGKLVHVKGDLSLIGQIRRVKIVESHTFSLLGELIDE